MKRTIKDSLRPMFREYKEKEEKEFWGEGKRTGKV